MKLKFNLKTLGLALVALVACAASYLIAADHIDAPAVTGTGSDITDVYAFQSPANANNMVFVVNVQGLLAPSATAAASFDEELMIEINIDIDIDKAVPPSGEILRADAVEATSEGDPPTQRIPWP